MEVEPPLLDPEDSSSGITNWETMELNGGPLPYFLPQVPNFKGSKPPQGTKCYVSINVHWLAYHSPKMFLGAQLSSWKKLLDLKEVLSWTPQRRYRQA